MTNRGRPALRRPLQLLSYPVKYEIRRQTQNAPNQTHTSLIVSFLIHDCYSLAPVDVGKLRAGNAARNSLRALLVPALSSQTLYKRV